MAADSEYWSRFWRRRLSRRRLLQTTAVGAAGLAAAGVVGCGGDDEEGGTQETAAADASPKAGGTFRTPLVGLSTGNPPSLDSQRQLTFLAQIPAAFHYSRLLKFASGRTEEVDGATSVLIDFSNVEGDAAGELPETVDGTTFNFKLRDGLKFHNVAPVNGRAVTSDDVKHSIDVFAAESPNRGNWLAQVDSVTVTDPQNFTIKLKQPFGPAFQVLFANNDGGPWVIPAEILDNKDAAGKTPVGSGPWIFDSWEPNVVIRWKKNPEYYDAPRPYLDVFEGLLTADPEQILANLKSETFDGSLWSADLWTRGRSELPDAQWFTGPEHVWGGAYFNFANPPFNDKRVRQALSMSIDRPGILSALDQPKATGVGGGLTHISQYDRFYVDPINDAETFGENAKYFQRNVEEAKALLSAAGFENGITVTANSSNIYGPGFGKQMEAFAASAGEAGFKMNLNLGEYAGYLSTTFLGDIPPDAIGLAPLQGSPIDPHNIFFSVFHPSSGRHNWGPKGAVPAAELPKANDLSPAGDADLLALWNQQAQELDEDARVELVRDVQRMMAESMYLVPWPGVSTAYVYQPWVKNIRLIRGYDFGAETSVHLWVDKPA
jgi:peptide/nickel transport system substrate-binding protein